MKITLRVLAREDVLAVAKRDSRLAEAFDLEAIVFEIDSSNELFDRFLELTRETSGSWFNPVMSFTKQELESARLFQLDCRGKIVNEKPRDYDWNAGRLKNTDYIRTSANLKIKIIDQIALSSNIKVRPNAVGCASNWMAEFVLAAPVAHIFESAGLTGFETRPILDLRSGALHEDFFLLYSSSIMPAAVLDVTTPMSIERDPEDSSPRELGCLTYDPEDLESVLDFNRTAEDWSSNSMPLWVVTSRVRDVFLRNKLRGWAFRPVLERGSDLHQEYLEMWKDLIERVSINPQNFF